MGSSSPTKWVVPFCWLLRSGSPLFWVGLLLECFHRLLLLVVQGLGALLMRNK